MKFVELRIPTAPIAQITLHGLWRRYGHIYLEALKADNLALQDEVLRVMKDHAADWYQPSAEDLELLAAMDPHERACDIATLIGSKALRIHLKRLLGDPR